MSKKGLEETPLNTENKYDYDTLFNEGERRGKFAQKTAIGEVRTSLSEYLTLFCILYISKIVVFIQLMHALEQQTALLTI